MATADRTDPDLWERVKDEITKGDKGGGKGEWSARKAQLAVAEYKKRGGSYRGAKSSDNDLARWTDEEWGTSSGKESRDTGERYLPKSARAALSDAEYDRTSAKKRRDTAKGRQYSRQPDDIADKTAAHRAPSDAGSGDATKAELMAEARTLGLKGRSRMTKADLSRAVEAARSPAATRRSADADGAEASGAAGLSKADLARIAGRLGVPARSGKTKDELRRAIRGVLTAAEVDDLAKADLATMAEACGIDGRTRMTKPELADAVRAAFR